MALPLVEAVFRARRALATDLALRVARVRRKQVLPLAWLDQSGGVGAQREHVRGGMIKGELMVVTCRDFS